MSEQQPDDVFEIKRDQLLNGPHTPTLLVTGLLVDLELHNGWVKHDQFVPIPTDIGKKLLSENQYILWNRTMMETLSLSFIGPANDVINLDCSLSGTIKRPAGDYGSVVVPSDIEITIRNVSDLHMRTSNPRLCVSVQIAEITLGNNGYVNGDLMRRNVTQEEIEREERNRRY